MNLYLYTKTIYKRKAFLDILLGSMAPDRIKNLFAAALVLVPLALWGAPPEFDPERHFPKGCFVYASLDVGGLRKGLQETPLGRIITHPGVTKALGRLPELLTDEIRQGTRDFTETMGKDLIEVFELMQEQGYLPR